ncbi:DUF6551 family protein [Rhodococcus jostii]|uniref:DUF6551 family protein n=1 Tax=Rhodococcus jostii TaxID=132919 RepID=UPI003631DB44
MANKDSGPNRIHVTSSLRWVRLDQMKINPVAQRQLSQSWVDVLTKDFTPDLMGFIHVSFRDGWYYVIDGQHRRQAAIQWLGSDQQVQCHVYENLTIEQEAHLFLDLNTVKRQGAMSKYKVALTAGQSIECDIDRIVRSLDLRIGTSAQLEEIGCITSIVGVYRKNGPGSLSTALRIIRDAYGYEGFKPAVISGLALVVDRYGSALDLEQMIKRLEVGTLKELHRSGKALRGATGSAQSQCYAHVMVAFYNRSRTGRIQPWWNLQQVG